MFSLFVTGRVRSKTGRGTGKSSYCSIRLLFFVYMHTYSRNTYTSVNGRHVNSAENLLIIFLSQQCVRFKRFSSYLSPKRFTARH